MDFTVCLHCRGGGLRNHYGEWLVRDDGIYGLFPEFEPYVSEVAMRPFLDRLRDPALPQQVGAALARVPTEWQVDARTKAAVCDFLSARATYLADNLLGNLRRAVL